MIYSTSEVKRRLKEEWGINENKFYSKLLKDDNFPKPVKNPFYKQKKFYKWDEVEKYIKTIFEIEENIEQVIKKSLEKVA